MKAKEELLKVKVESLKEFNKSLIPGLPEEVLGCRTEDVRNLAKKMVKENDYIDFLNTLPHVYHEENLLHGFILSMLKLDQNELFKLINEFLPYVTNWSVCDSMVKGSKTFVSNLDNLFDQIKIWINTNKTYYVRFGVVSMMSEFLKDEYIDQVLEIVSSIQTEDYYVNMSVAWLLATALINYYDKTIKLLEENKLNRFVHNKTIQKAIESYRIRKNIKEYLKTLKQK
jgi:3-methyladenine DNA glycosylase AlkD